MTRRKYKTLRPWLTTSLKSPKKLLSRITKVFIKTATQQAASAITTNKLLLLMKQILTLIDQPLTRPSHTAVNQIFRRDNRSHHAFHFQSAKDQGKTKTINKIQLNEIAFRIMWAQLARELMLRSILPALKSIENRNWFRMANSNCS